MKFEGLVTIKEIEGVIATHDMHLKGEMERRKEPLEYLDNVTKLAAYVGGMVEDIKPGDWAIGKEAFPEVNLHFIYQHGDDEVSSNLRVLFSGDLVKTIPGEDLVAMAIAYTNHMLRYIRDTNIHEKLPHICYQV